VSRTFHKVLDEEDARLASAVVVLVDAIDVEAE
jgi:hypothetical protein